MRGEELVLLSESGGDPFFYQNGNENIYKILGS